MGLGLHISKMIIKELGGDIICHSEWQKGTTFTFLIALDDYNLELGKIHRILNPNRNYYAKIKHR